ncbi:hypothetical protein D5F01_LYC25339 [Larimichthys crocea]|uniref:HAT C-terminal dimerisation domain-containing protein n=1 Tax=Larimichthys crocea TaxID=215358 RepID=A0A6G0HD56_LARCR|nr:hypothetical protein D5F01_LYC25339 [Larimichthys crocea]
MVLLWRGHLICKAIRITSDPTQPSHSLFSLLPSGRRVRSLSLELPTLTVSPCVTRFCPSPHALTPHIRFLTLKNHLGRDTFVPLQLRDGRWCCEAPAEYSLPTRLRQKKSYKESSNYQTMPLTSLQDDTEMESFWAEMATHKNKVTGAKEFERLSAIAKLVLVLPHSNANAERVFSMVGLNKTKTRNSLALDGTLSSIMVTKMANLEPCFRWEPPTEIIKASKKATGQYNIAHKCLCL